MFCCCLRFMYPRNKRTLKVTRSHCSSRFGLSGLRVREQSPVCLDSRKIHAKGMGSSNSVSGTKNGVTFSVDYSDATVQNNSGSTITVYFEKIGCGIQCQRELRPGEYASVESDSSVCTHGKTYVVNVYRDNGEHLASWRLSGHMEWFPPRGHLKLR